MQRRWLVLLILLCCLAAACSSTTAQNTDVNTVATKTATVAGPLDVTGSVVALAGDLVPNLGPPAIGRAAAVRDLTVAHNPAAVVHLGDLQYECGTLANFNKFYDNIYGALKPKIKPVIGNHEYCNGNDPNASGYFGYFGSQARPSGASYYSFNLNLPAGGHIHFLVINSNCLQWNKVAPGCGVTQAMRTWIRNDLAADNATCEIAVWHEPAFGSDVPYHGDGKDAMRGVWDTLESGNVDYVVTGHAHNYQRYRTLDHTGTKTSAGMASAIVGTGGRNLGQFSGNWSWHNALAASTDTHDGILKMVFTDSSHWIQAFKTVSGASLDSVPFSCRP